MVDGADPVPVTGTFMTMGTGQQALEVIFALRETFPIPRRVVPDSRSYTTEPPSKRQCTQPVGTSQATHIPTYGVVKRSDSLPEGSAPKAKKPSKTNRGPITESDRFLEQHEAYMGYRRKGRRPKALAGENNASSGSTAPVAKTENDDSSLPSSSQPTTSSTGATDNATCPSGAKVPNLLEILTALANSTPTGPAPNAAVLSTLGTIDANNATNGDQNPVLVNALKQLLDTLAQSSAPPPPLPFPSQPATQPTAPVKVEAPDDEVVVLDKENVNPSQFKKKVVKDEGLKLQNSTNTRLQSSSNILGSGNGQLSERLTQHLATRTNEPHTKTRPLMATQPSTSTSTSAVEFRRKRTLSEFMEERDAAAAAANASSSSSSASSRRHSSSSRREQPPTIPSQPFLSDMDLTNSSLRHYPRLLASYSQQSRLGNNSYYRTGIEPWSSPPRPSRNLLNPPSNEENSRNNPIVISDSPTRPQISASSPPRPTKKRYVVPEWARTSTATQPRLSEETQRAIEAAKDRKREEKIALRKRHSASAYARTKQKLKEQASAPASESDENTVPVMRTALGPPPLPVPPVKATTQPGPIAACADGPLIGIGAPSHRSATSSMSQATHGLPITPPRRRSLPTTPPPRQRKESGSLFTPTPKSWAKASPLFSPTFGNGNTVSPTANRKAAQSSPVHKNGQSSRQRAWIPPTSSSKSTSALSSESQRDKSARGEDDSDFLNQELDNPLEDPPPSSLPVASSDVPAVGSISTPGEDGDDEADPDTTIGGECIAQAKQQRWQGLPPSSPPPATSPPLHSQDLPSELDELPTATSDFEDASATTSPDDHGVTSPTEVTSPAEPSLSQASQNSYQQPMQPQDILQILQHNLGEDDGFAAYLNLGGTEALADFGPLFAGMEKVSSLTPPGVDLLEQFTNHALLSPESLDTPQDNATSTTANTPDSLNLDASSSTATIGVNTAAGMSVPGLDLGLDDPSVAFQSGVMDFDFSGFWETFKPLIENQGLLVGADGGTEAVEGNGTPASSAEESASGSPAPSAGQPDVEKSSSAPAVVNADSAAATSEVDHVKLAEDIRALFSGCLM
ncbi:hypothetical protein AX16_010617 [Volvariella volvacea WC 439]|nr:hypothetical protein AX16_010617 [Volvariella volvacea WC 439]